MYKSPFEYLISALATKDCVLCNNEANMLCNSCREVCTSEMESRCYKCNKLTKQHQVCTSCAPGSRLRRVYWLGPYTDVLQRFIYGLKYGRKRHWAAEFGDLLSEALPFFAANTVVVGVPTATSRIRARGYDQGQILARSFARRRGLRYLQPLERSGQADQIGKHRLERIKQIEASLYLSKSSSLNGATVILLDDVLTTGSTLETAAKLLRRAGARHVDAAVIARHLLK